jgi:hypothetical protein
MDIGARRASVQPAAETDDQIGTEDARNPLSIRVSERAVKAG